MDFIKLTMPNFQKNNILKWNGYHRHEENIWKSLIIKDLYPKERTQI